MRREPSESFPQGNEEATSPKRITPDHPRFLEEVEVMKKLDTRYLFGLKDINAINFYEQRIAGEQSVGAKRFYLSEIDSILRNSMKSLKKMEKNLGNTFADIEFEQLIYEAIGDPEIARELGEVYPDAFFDQGTKTQTLATGLILSDFSKMPLPLYRKILERHIRCYREKELEMQKNVPDLKKRFLENLGEQIKALNLPIPQECIEQRMKNVKVVFGDFLLYSDFGRSGDYNPENATVVLSTGELAPKDTNFDNKENMHSAYTHEMLHALSGLFIVAREKRDGDVEKTNVLRFGLSMEDGKLSWLNEAVTQYLELKLTGKEDSGYYKEEREIFRLLIENGIPESLFYKAYFEDQETEDGATKKSSLKELIKAINTKFGLRFLQKLDKIIQALGPEEGLREIERSIK